MNSVAIGRMPESERIAFEGALVDRQARGLALGLTSQAGFQRALLSAAFLNNAGSDEFEPRFLAGCKSGWAATMSYHDLGTGDLPSFAPYSQWLLVDLSDHPGRIPRHDRIRWNTPGDDCTRAHHRIPAYPHPWQEDGATS